MLILAAHIDVTTLALSAVISTAVAAFVSWLFTFALGGWIEVRKRRAIRRDDVRAELDVAVRTILGAVRQVQEPGMPLHAEGNKVTGFQNSFDELFSEMETRYRSIWSHLAGRENVNPERTIGWAITSAGHLIRRVKEFRDGAIGHPPDGILTFREAMRADLADSQTILENARDCLSVGWPRRWWRTTRLSRHLNRLSAEEKAGSLPRTPKTYTSTLPLDPRFTRHASHGEHRDAASGH
jgi:hypothetical protein